MWIVDTENFALETGPGYALFVSRDHEDGSWHVYLGLPASTTGDTEAGGSRTPLANCASQEEAQAILQGIFGAMVNQRSVVFVGPLQAQAVKLLERAAERARPSIATVDGIPIEIGPGGTVDKRAGRDLSRRERRMRGELPS